MKPNNSYIFPIALCFLFSLAISCTKDSPNSNFVPPFCDSCRKPAPPTISFQIRDSSWTRLSRGEYVSHLNELINSSVGSVKHIYNVWFVSENGLLGVPLNSTTRCYNGTISLSNSQGENILIYNSKPLSYYGQTVYESLPFTYLDVTIEMEK